MMPTTTRALTLLSLAAATLAGGCTKHQTEMILVITTEGVRIPDDVHKVHLTVADRQGSLDDTVYDADVELCDPMLTTGCYNIPVTAALYPGKARGGDSVRVQVDAIGGGGTVIADAALFTFANEESLRLDFVLYANCLGNVECAKRDQACGPLDTCIDLKPGQTNGPLDLALPHVDDMSLPEIPDMTLVDLKNADLTTVPPDLTQNPPDMVGCSGVVCDMGEQCVAGQCQPCGYMGGPCCFGPTAPPPTPNAGGTGGAGTCTQTNLVCDGTNCVNCGGDGELCCSMVPTCLSPDTCMAGTCQMPPMFPDMTMLGSDMSLMPSDMSISISLD
jgi:hypothetical protein